MRENHLSWFGHVVRRPMSAYVRRCEAIMVGQEREMRGTLLKTWEQVIGNDVSIREVDETIALDRLEWCEKIHFDDPA